MSLYENTKFGSREAIQEAFGIEFGTWDADEENTCVLLQEHRMHGQNVERVLEKGSLNECIDALENYIKIHGNMDRLSLADLVDFAEQATPFKYS